MRGKSGSMERGVPRRRRPRPVVAAGVEAVLLRGDDLAKGWLLALLEDAPLDDAAAILAGDIARDGPRICEAVVRAVYDESDLRRIEPQGVLEPLVSRTGEIAGARTSEAAAQAVDGLRGIVWSALHAELVRTDPELLAEAAERLSLVADVVRGAVLRRAGNGETGTRRTPRMAPLRVAGEDVPGGAREPEPPPAVRSEPAPAFRAEPPPPAFRAEPPPPAFRAEPPPPAFRSEPSPPFRAEPPPAFRSEPPASEADRPADETGSPGGETVAPGGVPLSAGPRDAPARDALWIGALRDEIVRAGRARLPLSLLLVELEEAERVLAVEPLTEAAATFGRFAQAVRTAVRRRDVLACETDSRAWVIARDTGRAGAQALGARIVTAVPNEESWRGAPLTVSVGLAVLGEDGHNASALIDAAEQTKFAAEASGIGIVTEFPGDGGTEPPPTLVS
jgi:GGDEF domain-containing protein